MQTPTPNRLLSALSPASRDILLSKCSPVDLPIKYQLYQAETTPSHAYFMMSGMGSVVTTMEDGMSAEVGVVGCEGLVGSLQLLGPAKTSTESFVQIAGSALKMPHSELRKAFRSSEEIRFRILEFHQEELIMARQIAGCNRLHNAEERLARWLLMAQDRIGSERLELTQEFLAMMLGSRRTTVTLVASTLQRAGLIEYSRGRLTILDRKRMEATACDCYQISKSLLDGLYREKFEAA